MHRRLVYSSLDSQSTEQWIPQQKSRKKLNKSKMKRVEAFNAKMESAARVYLNQLKHIAKPDIRELLSGHQHWGSEYPSLEKKLYEELQSRKKQKYQKIKQQQQSIRYQIDHTVETGQQEAPISRGKQKKFRKLNHNSMAEQFRARYGIRDSGTFSNLEKQLKKQRKLHIKSTCLPKYLPNSKVLQFEDQEQKQRDKTKRGKLDFKIPISSRYQIGSKQRALLASQTARQYSLSPSNIKSDADQGTLQTSSTRNKSTARNVYGFVINQKDELVSNTLLAQGWKPFGQKSEHFTLKWTYNQNSKDFQLLQSAFKNRRKMYFNHISNNKLINKQDFCYSIRQIKDRNVEQFIPQTYIISSERRQFLQSYQSRAIYACLRKHYEYLKLKNVFGSDSCNFFKSRQERVQQFSKFLTSINNETIEDSVVNHQDCGNIAINIPILFNLLVLSCMTCLTHSEQQSSEFFIKFSKIINDASIINSIVILNRADLPVQQYSNANFTKDKATQAKKLNQKQVCMVDGQLKMVKTFGTPSKLLIEGVQLLYNYFEHQLKPKFLGGARNLWIVKPCSGSKGGGIELVDRPDRVNQIVESKSYRIVQKYIENIWTLNASSLQMLESEHKNLLNKKFDIRQWVLLVPPKSYIFSSFYLRVCSKQYSFSALNDPCSHLSNFSVNRNHYTNLQQSVVSEQQFGRILQKLNLKQELSRLKYKIHQRIKLLTDHAMKSCDIIDGTFEIVGFDIVIDQQFNPWIIECNMSPACSLRTAWLKEMKQAMTTGALQIILPKNLYDSQEQTNPKHMWIQLSGMDN